MIRAFIYTERLDEGMFRDRTDRIGHNPPMKGYGAAVTSGLDGPAVFIAGFDGANRLYTWDDGSLCDRACGILADETRSAIGVVAADFDADGHEEIYVHNTDAYGGYTRSCDLLLDRIASEHRRLWCDVFSLAVNGDRPNFHAGRSVGAIDRYGTGRYGAFVACYGVRSRFYELGDDGELTDMSSAVGLDFEGGGRSVVVGPIVSDGMDLFVGAEGGANRLYRNDRGHFVDVARSYGLDDPHGNARGATLVDTGTGEFGLLVGNWGGATRLFDRSHDGGQFVDRAPESLARTDGVRTVLAADFDNDGQQELFVNAMGAPNRLFRTAPDRPVAVPIGDAEESGRFGTGATVADFDRDGSLELLVVHGELDAAPLSMYTVPNDNDWLRVRPTTQYGAPARGATVYLETDHGTQRRVIDAGSGYLCQCEPVAHFGLGRSQSPDRLTVSWPDGRTTTIDDPTRCTEIEVPHPVAPRF